jgi:hypothetical protein
LTRQQTRVSQIVSSFYNLLSGPLMHGFPHRLPSRQARIWEKDVIEIACQLSLPPDVAVAQLSKTPGRQDLANRCDWSILGCQSVESLLPG